MHHDPARWISDSSQQSSLHHNLHVCHFFCTSNCMCNGRSTKVAQLNCDICNFHWPFSEMKISQTQRQRFSIPVHTKCMQRRSNVILSLCYPCSSWLVICQSHFHFWPFLSICHRSVFTFLNFHCFCNWWSILNCFLACSLRISLPVLDNQQPESLEKQKNFVNCELKTHCTKELPNDCLFNSQFCLWQSAAPGHWWSKPKHVSKWISLCMFAPINFAARSNNKIVELNPRQITCLICL